MYDKQTLARLIADDSAPIEPQWLDSLLQRYPTFYYPAAMLVKRRHGAISRDELSNLYAMLAVHCPDRAALADYADIADADWANIYPPRQLREETSTQLTIETFLNTYGNQSAEEDALLERLIFNPVAADYFADTDIPFDPDDPLALPPELRDDYVPSPAESPQPTTPAPDTTVAPEPTPPPFVGMPTASPTPPPFTGLRTQPQAEPTAKNDIKSTNGNGSIGISEPQATNIAKQPATPAPTPETPSDDTPLMESLSKFFIKKGRYERAYDIISKLSLKYPEKSVYFAEQLRHLQKLIINQKYSQDNKTKI